MTVALRPARARRSWSRTSCGCPRCRSVLDEQRPSRERSVGRSWSGRRAGDDRAAVRARAHSETGSSSRTLSRSSGGCSSSAGRGAGSPASATVEEAACTNAGPAAQSLRATWPLRRSNAPGLLRWWPARLLDGHDPRGCSGCRAPGCTASSEVAPRGSSTRSQRTTYSAHGSELDARGELLAPPAPSVRWSPARRTRLGRPRASPRPGRTRRRSAFRSRRLPLSATAHGCRQVARVPAGYRSHRRGRASSTGDQAAVVNRMRRRSRPRSRAKG